MSDATAPAETDIAYLKRLAVAGRGEPAPFLLLMAVFGGAYGLWATVTCVTVLIAFLTGEGDPVWGSAAQTVSAWGFTAATLAFAAALGWTLWRTFGPHRIAVSRSATAIWSAAFVGLIAVICAAFASADRPHAVFDAGVVSSVLLMLWGCAWWATAIAADRRWLLAVAIGSVVAAVALPAVGTSFWGFPILAACLLLLAFLPAVLLMRERNR